MAIRMMIDKEAAEKNPANVEVVTNFPGYKGTLYMETTHKGHVVDLGEINGYDDSDFYAVVWEAGATEPKRIFYATTRGWSYPNGAAIDATPEIMAAYKAYLDAKAEAARIARAAAALARVERGKVVKVVRGRKVPVGTVGRCFWVGEGHYGLRVGLENADGRVFTAATNVEVMLPVTN